MTALRPFVTLVLASSFAVACSSEGGDDRGAKRDPDKRDSVSVSLTSDSGVNITSSFRDVAPGDAKPSFTEEPGGGASMKTSNGALVMSLRHDSVVVAFSDSIREHVKQEMKREVSKDSAKGEDGAFAEVMKGVVVKSVSAGLSEIFDKSRGFPVSSLRDVSYENGAIRFDYVKEPTWTFDNFKTDKTPLLEQFHPADAARFVGAVRARLKQS